MTNSHHECPYFCPLKCDPCPALQVQFCDEGPDPVPGNEEYWVQTRTPLNSLIFLVPLIVIYEVGVLAFGGSQPETVRNGADYWMRLWLSLAGMGQAILLPLMVIGGLLVWQVGGKYPWRISLSTFKGMAAESIVFAYLLMLIGQTQYRLMLALSGPEVEAVQLSVRAHSTQAITYIGAGVYEEFLFRLCLLPLVYFIMRIGFSPRWSAAISIGLTSLLFSSAHYLGPAGESLALYSFIFRTTAGMFFAVLFFTRGFGITVGCHITYDLLVGIVMVL